PARLQFVRDRDTQQLAAPIHRRRRRHLTDPGGTMDDTKHEIDGARREALKVIGAGTVTAAGGLRLLGSGAASAAQAAAGPMPLQATGGDSYNILFILTDQERYFRPGELPNDYLLPAHERLANKGIVFENHQINSAVCTSSRSVLYTGQHIQHTKMFD